MNVIHVIKDVILNFDGLCALSSNSDKPYLAYPRSLTAGEIQIFDTNNLVSILHCFQF